MERSGWFNTHSRLLSAGVRLCDTGVLREPAPHMSAIWQFFQLQVDDSGPVSVFIQGAESLINAALLFRHLSVAPNKKIFSWLQARLAVRSCCDMILLLFTDGSLCV